VEERWGGEEEEESIVEEEKSISGFLLPCHQKTHTIAHEMHGDDGKTMHQRQRRGRG
jgi:hypothetical protein